MMTENDKICPLGLDECIRSQFDADTRHIENNREWQMNKQMRSLYAMRGKFCA